jgi:hypothetical protein
VEYSGSRWEHWDILGPTLRATNVATSTFPPKTGWVDVTTTNFSVSYESFWTDSEEFVEVTFADLQAKLSGEENVWIKWLLLSNGTCVVKELVQYPLADVLTSAQDSQNRRYFRQGTCGAGYFSFVVLIDDVGNELIDDEGNKLGYFP